MYKYIVYDRTFGDFPAKNALYHIYTVHIRLWPTLHMSAFTVYGGCMYGVFSREWFVCTVIYGVRIHFAPTLSVAGTKHRQNTVKR